MSTTMIHLEGESSPDKLVEVLSKAPGVNRVHPRTAGLFLVDFEYGKLSLDDLVNTVRGAGIAAKFIDL